MIFVTTGSSLPFDRLVRAVDALAPSFPDERFLAQIGDGTYRPDHVETVRTLVARDYAAKVAECRVIVAHAGMGSLITAMELQKPIVIMPRRLAFDEINTDHQVDTAKKWAGRAGVFVAMDETELHSALTDALYDPGQSTGLAPVKGLAEKIRAFIEKA